MKKALGFLYDLTVGTIGGIIGISLLGILWACNTLIIIGEDLWKVVSRKS